MKHFSFITPSNTPRYYLLLMTMIVFTKEKISMYKNKKSNQKENPKNFTIKHLDFII